MAVPQHSCCGQNSAYRSGCHKVHCSQAFRKNRRPNVTPSVIVCGHSLGSPNCDGMVLGFAICRFVLIHGDARPSRLGQAYWRTGCDLVAAGSCRSKIYARDRESATQSSWRDNLRQQSGDGSEPVHFQDLRDRHEPRSR